MTENYDERIHEIVDHSHALVLWILAYVESHNLPIADEKDFPAFELHLKRLGALLDEIAYPFPLHPSRRVKALIIIFVVSVSVSQSFLHVAASPTEISQQHPPTIKVTLPHVTIFISNCYLW